MSMIMNILNSARKTAIATMACTYMIGSPATATYYGDWDVYSDAGTYAPVALGDNIQINACSSTLFNINNSAQSYSICDLPSLDKFRLYWYNYEPNMGVQYMQSYIGTDAVNGTTPMFATGAGTFFSTQSTYYIGLYLIAEAESYIDLPGGGQAYTGNGTLGDFRWSNAFNVTAAAVSEPTALLLLFPGLVYIARRQRRKLRTVTVSS